MDTLIAIIIIFGVLVAVHEWGHLYFAKKAGILCREFAIGFGPKIFSTKKNETVYTVRLLPLGGFVRMAGEDPEAVQIKPGYEVGLVFNEANKVREIIVNNKSKHPEAKIVSVERIDLERKLQIEAYTDEEDGLKSFDVDEKCDVIVDEKPEQIAPIHRQYGYKKPWQKAMAIFAGPFMNFVLAFVILVAFGLINGVPQDDAALGEFTEESPARDAGLEEGDRVVSIEGEEVDSWTEMTRAIQQHPNEEIAFQVERNGELLTVPVETGSRYDEMAEEEIGIIGVTSVMAHSPLEAVQYGASQVYQVSMLIFDVLGMIVTGDFSLDYLSGPVGIYNYTGEAAALGIAVLIQWAAMLSVNLGIVNLLPLPALDGGRLLFIFAEAIRGKPIDPQKEGMIHFIGFALLFLLMLVVTWNDINKFFM
ncbi:regulator of sigma E protease [Alteribacillus persepolensis]|uniref:Zinc metalloprotease n=1 Tax=Alteribacillus persepolensis TaxID=568899 RepID=A0A1G7YRX9_9BACI|nr:RIP metalloprotease RseP [Alteribacillus persepolensis]SDG99006.1 regulator of sigma E protease [Alteribacillus persepolensis]